jgi:Leucine-rich repeat (LRR) protein
LTLFPNIETIECSFKDIINYRDIMNNVEIIKLIDYGYIQQKDIEDIPENIRKKIESITLKHYYIKTKSLIQLLPNLKSITYSDKNIKDVSV